MQTLLCRIPDLVAAVATAQADYDFERLPFASRGALTHATAAGLTGTTISYPTTLAAGQAYAPAYQSTVQSELPALGITPDPATGGQTFTTSLSKTGTLWADTVEQLSGGTRPGFASAIDYWVQAPSLPNAGAPHIYTSPLGDRAQPRRPAGTGHGHLVGRRLVAGRAAGIHGDPGIPVLSVHGIGDLFVPLSMDQRYDAMMVAHGQGGLFVDRAIREVTHCGYTTNELSSAFSALVSWIHTGKRPAGDNILDPRAVASPLFGCRFTDPAPGAHPEFKSPVTCPAGSRS